MRQLEQRGPLPGHLESLFWLLPLASLAQCHVLFTLLSPDIVCLSAPDVTWANEGVTQMTNSYLITNCQCQGLIY